VGILIGDKDERMKGYAYEALLLLARYSFDILNMHQLFCHIENSNQASLRLFSKAGFRTCGVIRDWIVYNDIWHDVTMMQLLRPSKLI
jgi:diamine N-acetyltransferase